MYNRGERKGEKGDGNDDDDDDDEYREKGDRLTD